MYKSANCAKRQEDREQACRERRLLMKDEDKSKGKVANDKSLP